MDDKIYVLAHTHIETRTIEVSAANLSDAEVKAQNQIDVIRNSDFTEHDHFAYITVDRD